MTNKPSSEEKALRKSFSKSFGLHIKTVRNKSNLTQEELAHLANLHSTYVGHIETGTYTPSIFVLWKISKALNVSLTDLLAGFSIR